MILGIVPFRLCASFSRSNMLILESAAFDPDGNISTFTKDVRNLAGKLRNVEPTTFNLLECAGAVRVKDPKTLKCQSFDFLFKIPKGMHHLQSLRKILLACQRGSFSECSIPHRETASHGRLLCPHTRICAQEHSPRERPGLQR